MYFLGGVEKGFRVVRKTPRTEKPTGLMGWSNDRPSPVASPFYNEWAAHLEKIIEECLKRKKH
jgi:hypothetical protein